MELTLNTAVTVTTTDAATDLGVTLTDASGSWQFEEYLAVLPPGMIFEAGNFPTFVEGTPTEVGTWTIDLLDIDRYGNTSSTHPFTMNVVDPDATPEEPPAEEPTPEPTTLDSIAQDAVEYLGRPIASADGTPSRHLKTAKAQAPVILEFVRGYTRGRGFEDWDAAHVLPLDLRTVVVSALSRVVQNPEQVAYYQAADYAEKGQVLNGFTIPELGILNRYRRRTNLGAVSYTETTGDPVTGEQYATTTYVDTAIANAQPDLTPYALRSEIPTETNLDAYALKTELPDLTPYALTSDVVLTVNGTAPDDTGNVTVDGGGGGGSSYELRGTGFPEGVVTASPGTYYTDTAGTNGAWRWLKASGTGNTGWTVIYGDTGWRRIETIEAGLGSAVTAGALAIRRINNTIEVDTAARLTWHTVGNGGQLWVTPSGFRPIFGSTITGKRWDATATGFGYKTWASEFAHEGSPPLSGYHFYAYGTYGTREAWPTILPGTAA